jgi:hypothetical protein
MVGVRTSADGRVRGAVEGMRVGVSAGGGAAGVEQAAAIRRNRGTLTARYRLIIFGLDIGKPLKVYLIRVK